MNEENWSRRKTLKGEGRRAIVADPCSDEMWRQCQHVAHC